MSNKKYKFLVIFDMVLLVASLVANMYGFINTYSIQLFLNLSAVIFAVGYLSYDYKKPGNQFFKYFLWFLALKEIFCLTKMAMHETFPAFAFVILLINYTCIVVLAISKDFGYRNSLICCGLTFIISVVCLMASFSAESSEDLMTLLIYNGTRTILSMVTALMVYAKYQDKFARGSK